MNKRRFILILLVFAFLGIMLAVVSYINGNYGYARIVFKLPETQGMSVKVNGNGLQITGLSQTYKLKPGNKSLEVTKSGYEKFKTSFTVKRGSTVVIYVAPQPTKTQNKSTAQQQIKSSVGESLGGLKVVDAVYFYNNTWAFVTVELSDGNTAFVVSSQSDIGTWDTQIGPGTLFTSSQLVGIPDDVVNYMQQKQLVLEEG